MGYSKETKEKYRKIVIEYIKNNPLTTYDEIAKNTKVKINRVFLGGMKEAFKEARVTPTRSLSRRSRKKQIEEVINYIRKNPNCTIPEILRDIRVTIPRVFGSIVSAYEAAGIEYKRKKKAQGTSLPHIRNRAEKFEKEVLNYLSKMGKIRKKVYIPNGRRWADGLFYCNNKKYVVEVKNITKRRITMSQIKQVEGYMAELDCKEAFLIHSYNFGEMKEYHLEEKIIYVLPFEILTSPDQFLDKEMRLTIKEYKRKV
jgi:hypothetical protein